MNAMLFGGKNVFVSPLCTVATPIKRSKNKRLQKKFIKKFGYRHVPGCLQTPMGLVMHPVFYERFKNECNIE